MIIFTCLISLGIFGFCVSKERLWYYIIFSAVAISSLYLFYTPPMEYDLFRHYEMFQIIRKMSLPEILFSNLAETNAILATYQDSTKLYLIYVWLISRLGVKELLPMLTGVIIYCATGRIIVMAAKDFCPGIEDWKASFCFFFLLIVSDFRSISGIRNMLAFAVFACVLYWDLVRNGNKIVCFSIYFLLAYIHSSIFIFIVLRLCLMATKVIPVWIMAGIVFGSSMLIGFITDLLSHFASISTVAVIIRKINTYIYDGGTETIFIRAAFHLLLLCSFTAIYLYVKRKLWLPKILLRYGDYFLLTGAFMLGMIRQYDLFVRTNMLMYFMIAPFLLWFFQYAVASTPLIVLAQEGSQEDVCMVVIIYIMIWLCVVCASALYIKGYYMPMDFSFHLKSFWGG